MKDIILIFRKPFPGQFSIEYLFYNISSILNKKNISINNHQLAYYSKGLINRILNVFSLISYKNKIVHITGDVHYAILGAWFSKRILTIHDFGFMHNKSWVSRNIYWLIWIYLPVKFSHQVTVISQNTKLELLSYVNVDETKVQVIGDFVDDIYKPFTKNLHVKTPRLLQIGTTFNKNIERLIEAIQGINCTLVIIGKLPVKLIQLLEKNHITYENKYDLSIQELYDEYKRSDLLCYVSTLEGFGMPILEAQTTGVPVITSNCSSMPEVAGKGALLVNPLSVTDIRNGIIKIITDKSLQQELQIQGFANTERYSKETVAHEYADLYRRL